jgi:hypothetical protein
LHYLNIEGAEEVARNVSMQAALLLLDESGVDAATIEKKLKSQKIFASRRKARSNVRQYLKVNLLVSLKIIPW